MNATARGYGTAGLALLTASMVAVAPVITPPLGGSAATVAVRLTAGDNPILDVWNQDLSFLGLNNLTSRDWLDIPPNLGDDLLNIPYNFFKGLNEFATAGLGYPGVVGIDKIPANGPVGTDSGYDPQHPNPVLTGTEDAPAAHPIYTPIGVDHQYVETGIGGTGSWWMESTGNTWGWDQGNFGQVLGISNMVVPIPQLSTPFAYELQAAAMQTIIANPEACPFECSNVLAYVLRWFNTPLDKMFEGVTPAHLIAPDPGDLGPMGLTGYGDQPVQFDPFFIFTSFFKSLTMDPDTSDNGLDTVFSNYASWFTDPINNPIADVLHFGEDIFNDFVPVLPGSFVYWGAPAMYSVPTWVGGLIQEFTGFANPMQAFSMAPGGAYVLGPYFNADGGQPIAGGTTITLDDLHGIDGAAYAEHPLGHAIGPFDLPAALAGGLINWVDGLLGYLDPYTYLAGLGVNIDMGATGLEQTIMPLLDKIGLGDVDLTGLFTGLADWHDGLYQYAIQPLAELTNDIIPWYAPLSVGMENILDWTAPSP